MGAIRNNEIKCRFFSFCSFYQERMPNLPSMIEIFKMDFCLGSPEFCARFMLYSTTGEDYVPEDLLPYEIDRVKEVI